MFSSRILAGIMITVLLCTYCFLASRQNHAVAATPNPYYNISPSIFPDKNSFIPTGTSYTDTVPATLDLAQIAALWIQGASRATVPMGSIRTPAGPALFSPTNPSGLGGPKKGVCDDDQSDSPPCLDFRSGYTNWGKFAIGDILAREMSGYDLNDLRGTLSAEYQSITTMLSWDTELALQQFASANRQFSLTGLNLTYGFRAITPSSYIVQALVDRYREDPSTTLANTINEFVKMHADFLRPYVINGGTYYDCLDPSTETLPASQWETAGGYVGAYSNFAFDNGRAAMAMFDWYNVSGNQQALDIGMKLADFIRNFSPMWVNPDPSRFPDINPNQFEGHIYSYLNAGYALTEDAAARIQGNRNDPIAAQDLSIADNMYNFIKQVTQGDVLGNFGSSGPMEFMISLGVQLSEQGEGPYWDEIERWTRDTLSDRQIDLQTVDQEIGNTTTGNEASTDIGEKVTGLFFSDATHSLAVPLHAWMYNPDNASNPLQAVYDVWKHTVDINGGVAKVNFDLNRASRYLDVKSDLPYRGQVHTVMKGNIGPVVAVEVRVPSWADKSKVTVTMQTATTTRVLTGGADWNWDGQFARIIQASPSVTYIVKFPIKVYTMQFNDIRSQDEFWFESSFPSPRGGAAEDVQTFTGTFRGDTLVDATPRPTTGVPRYQRQNLASLPATNMAPPMMTVTRFVAGGGN